ncbi:methyltransferase family protein [Yunchengibacter salinarum]|uniref:methyltransferase family protein n=1 Tax=Yunchengibacter salinarum TaxID=3133399 RepID=UPI0035B680D2
MLKTLYRAFAGLGSLTIWAAFIWGWRHDPMGPVSAVWVNLALYGGFIAVHMAMITPAFKKTLYGDRRGGGLERRIFVSVAVLTWLALLYFHQPLPGPAPDLPAPLRFVGLTLSLAGFMAFTGGASQDQIDRLIGTPGHEISHSHDDSTPLMDKGAYGRVRHPMYAGAVVATLSSILMHPNAAQAFWAVLVSLTFILFIPIEERQLLKARGDAYRQYREKVRWRLFPGLW